jgi:hypothetical protein
MFSPCNDLILLHGITTLVSMSCCWKRREEREREREKEAEESKRDSCVTSFFFPSRAVLSSYDINKENSSGGDSVYIL